MKDKRRKTQAQKARTKARRIAKATAKRRLLTWTEAAKAAERAGHPINVALHITWSALMGGDRREGHILGRPAVTRERRVWSALRLVAARARVPWLAGRGPEHDQTRGLHLHLVLHLPDTAALRDAIAVVERLSGAPAEWTDMRGRTVHGLGRGHRGVVACSACRGWFMQRNDPEWGGTAALLAYVAKGTGSDRVEGQHRLSNELVALTKSAA
jgi:hypothetical protein